LSERLECSIINHMKTKIKRVKKEQLDNDIIMEAGEILRAGGLVAFPTETVYGLGADALNEGAAEKIYAAKGRPSDNPLIVHITEIEDLERITDRIPREAFVIADRYWPGPLTMIFEKTDAVPYGTTGGLDTVAVRMPSDAAARAVIRAGGGFIAAPSANTSGRPSPTTAGHVEEDLSGKIEMIIDGGPVEIGVESTILDMTVTPPMILRPGAVTKEMLQELIGEVAEDVTTYESGSKTKPKAPGMKYRHYAPRAALSIVEGNMDQVVDAINKMADEKLAGGFKVGIIGTRETVGRYICGNVKSIGTREDEATIAVHLYGILREFDQDQVDYIYSESFATGGMGSAIMNRLLKAAGHHVINI
jgi:tRNA threonylcarbamoyl adenosine modification protein (Sua5/YciO/YrdC/YwlC family)